MSPTAVASPNGTAAVAESQKWLQSSVRNFFTNFNWENHPPEVQELKVSALQGSDVPLSLTLSVSQFLGAIAWDGASVAAPAQPEAPASESPSAKDFTLDDFSSLF